MFKKRADVRTRETKGNQGAQARFGKGWGAIGGVAGTALTVLAPGIAHAFPLYNGTLDGNPFSISLNTTVSYSSFYRVGQPSATLLNGPVNPATGVSYAANGNDGDQNFRHGFFGNVFEILPVLDIKNGDFGAHFSGEYFINTSYLGTTANDSPGTINPVLPKADDFASETREANGMNGRMLDAFVYGSVHFGKDEGQTLTLKAGQQTLMWGQSLFFPTNSIAGGMAPIDVISANDLVNPQSQQVFLPVGQIVLTYQPNPTYTFQGYYQYQWEPTALQGVGSYFSNTDVVGPGGQRILATYLPSLPLGALSPLIPPAYASLMTQAQYLYLTRGKDITPPSQNGQFGASVQATYGDYDVGLYALRFDAKTPETAYTTITGLTDLTGLLSPSKNGTSIGTYRMVYPEDIQLYGASLSTTVGVTNVAGEISGRRNMPLVAGSNAGSVTPANPGNANSDPLYPVGNTIDAQVSAIYGSPALSWDPGGVTVSGEVEYNQVVGSVYNAAMLAPGRSRSAAAFDVGVTPAYLNVLPQLELQFPVSLTYNFAGNSLMDQTMNHGTGSYTVGILATYYQTWQAGINYVGYFGRPGLYPDPNVTPNADRSYVTFNIQHTF